MDATEYKANEIALSLARLYLDDYGDGEDTVDTKTYERCRQAALEMAKWKDEQFKLALKALADKTGDPRSFYDDLKPLDSDISQIVSDNFWNLV